MAIRLCVWLALWCLAFSFSVNGYQHIGCFNDKRDRDMLLKQGRHGNQALYKCNLICTSKRFGFFGVQDGDECWCSNGYGRYGRAPQSDCNRRCADNGGAFCGGPWRNSVYASDFNPGYRRIGCFADAYSRDLTVLAGDDEWMSVLRCHSLCKERNFAYFGVEYAKECFCGNSFGTHGARPGNECNMKCSGDRDTFCGGSWRLSVFSTGLNPFRISEVTNDNNNVKNALISLIKSHYEQLPADVVCNECLISRWKRRNIKVETNTHEVANLAVAIAAYPENIKSKLRVLQFGANAATKFEDFHFRIEGPRAVRTAYIGFANRVNSKVHLGMMSADFVVDLVQKQADHYREVCWKNFWGQKKCENRKFAENRGLYAEEIKRVDEAIRSEMFRMFAERVGEVTL